MLEWWDELLGRAEDGEDIREIRVWGTVGNKTDIVLEWHTNNAREQGAWEGRLADTAAKIARQMSA
jgi:hypothetical protein